MNDSSRQIVVYSLLWAGPPSWERVYSGSRQPWWIASSCKTNEVIISILTIWWLSHTNDISLWSWFWSYAWQEAQYWPTEQENTLVPPTGGSTSYTLSSAETKAVWCHWRYFSVVPCLSSLRKADYIYCFFSFARIKQLSGHLSPLKFSYTAMVLCKFRLNRSRKRVFCFACFSFPRAVKKAIFLKHKLVTQLLLGLLAKPGINTLPCYTKACLYRVTIPLNNGKYWTGRKSKSKLIRK